jgi:hypothetical protein
MDNSDNIDNISNIDNIDNIDKYDKKLKEYKKTLGTLLDEFRSIYILFKKNQTNNEYIQQYANIKRSINNIFNKIFVISNNINAAINELNKQAIRLNKPIEEEKKKNNYLKEQLGITSKEKNAADEMLSDYKDIYDIRYLRNWGIALSILGVIATSRILYISKSPRV